MKKINSILFLFFVLVTGISAQTALTSEFPPTNIGGKNEFKRVFEQELIYPSKELKNKTGGKVIVHFTVGLDSIVTNTTVTSSGFPDIDKEALRIFKLYQWTPAVKGGVNVTSNWAVTFDFEPNKYDKICRERGFKIVNYSTDAPIDSSGIIYKKADQLPAYQKGIYALQDFIKENLEYPRQAQVSNIQGTVVLRFVVEPSGLVTNIGVDKTVGGGCDQEAIRVLEMIKWYPGKKNGNFARVQMSFPFYFILNEEFKDNSAGEQK